MSVWFCPTTTLPNARVSGELLICASPVTFRVMGTVTGEPPGVLLVNTMSASYMPSNRPVASKANARWHSAWQHDAGSRKRCRPAHGPGRVIDEHCAGDQCAVPPARGQVPGRTAVIEGPSIRPGPFPSRGSGADTHGVLDVDLGPRLVPSGIRRCVRSSGRRRRCCRGT